MNSEIVAYYRHSAEQLKILKKILKKNNLITDEKIINITPKKLVSLVEDVFECDISLQNRKQTTVFGRQAAAFILKNFTVFSPLSHLSMVGWVGFAVVTPFPFGNPPDIVARSVC